MVLFFLYIKYVMYRIIAGSSDNCRSTRQRLQCSAMSALTTKNSQSVVVKETDAWLTNFISDRTRSTYKKAIEEFASFSTLESPDDLYDVDSHTVLAWREHLMELEYSSNSVANRLSALSSLFKHLCDKQIVQVNPVQGIKRPKTPQEGVTPSICLLYTSPSPRD